ncbi:MAG TPA: TIGR01777 family oxidoreductase [Chthoniobacteraceae bacterium]|nr:TIGR01777 family oxidoreductase [Chthoniobacteraceae bacterium]
MKIGITGVTGLIGKRIAGMARERGHEVIGFSRHPRGAAFRRFGTDEPPDVSGCDAIINLAGENVAGIWKPSKKRAIRDSRVLGTRRIVEAIQRTRNPPRILVNASGIGVYGNAGETVTDENGRHSAGFLAEVCEAWEAEALHARSAGVRVVMLRTSMVLACGGGALGAMLPVFRLGLGGRLGSGRQWVSWIHIDDEAAIALAAVGNPMIEGPVNVTAPNPVRNIDFTRALAKAVHRPAPFWVPSTALRLALGGFSAELLQSRHVIPAAAAAAGYAFKYPHLPEALADLLSRP